MASGGDQGLSINQRRLSSNPRLNEYFAVVGLDSEESLSIAWDGVTSPQSQTSDDGSSALFDLGPSTHPSEAKFKADVLNRFPLYDHEDNPFPANLALFCLPGGLRLTRREEIPTFFAFVHTRANGQHMFGFCLTFYEKLQQARRAELQSACDEWERLHRVSAGNANIDAEGTDLRAAPLQPDVALYTPKCLCLLSSWPYFNSYRSWLTNLFLLSLSPQTVPLERHICNFMLEVPNAIPGRTVSEQVDDSLCCRDSSMHMIILSTVRDHQLDIEAAFT